MNDRSRRRTFLVFAFSVGAGLAVVTLAVIMLVRWTTDHEPDDYDVTVTIDIDEVVVSERIVPSTMRSLGKSLWINDDGFIFDGSGTPVGVWGIDA